MAHRSERLKKRIAPVVEGAFEEHWLIKPKVAGSIPVGRTTAKEDLAD
jgi:hypothetical protein